MQTLHKLPGQSVLKSDRAGTGRELKAAPNVTLMRFLKLLRYVEIVARIGSIRSAGEQLGISSSALNRRILDLETDLGINLFERDARGVRLTAAGEHFLTFARKTLGEAEMLHAQIDEVKELRRGHISVSAVAAVASDALPRAIVDFQRSYPGITFSVTVVGSEQVVRTVVDYEAECGIAFDPLPNRDFVELASARQVLCAIMHRDHPLATASRLRLSDCTSYPIAIADYSWSGRLMLNDLLAKSDIALEFGLQSNSFEMLVGFARESHGICFQIRGPKSPVAFSVDLVAVPLVEARRSERRLVLGVRRDRALPRVVAAFCELLNREIFQTVDATSDLPDA